MPAWMRTAAVLGALTLALPGAGVAGHWDLFYKICPEELFFVPEVREEIPIPVGCEIVDCCPGCPGPEPIDWRIRFEGEALETLTLRFDGLEREQLGKLEVEGAGSLEGNTLTVKQGETLLRGLPGTAVSGRPPVAMASYAVNEAGLKEMSARAAMEQEAAAAGESDAGEEGDEGEGRELGSGEVVIEQLLGPYVVNSYRFRYGIRFCPELRRTDKLRIRGNGDGDTTISVLDYRSTSGCRNDRIIRTVQQANVGSALSNAGCNSEVAVFSDNNAMAFDTPVTTWTDPLGDIHTVGLGDILRVPLNIWVTRSPSLSLSLLLLFDLINTNLIYDDNNIGVRFVPSVQNVSGNAAAVTAIGTGCANAGGLSGTAWYGANQLNVYYVPSAFTGVNCGADRNVNYLGTTANLGSLPHEIGHAYGLRPSSSWGHTNNLPGFSNTNVMWGGGPGTRKFFTVGQSFRINVHTLSMLNVNGDRTGATRNCAPNVSSTTCPALSLDSLPH